MRIEKFKNVHKNQKTFIICNGPSLNNIDVSKLNGNVLFVLNRGYLLKERGLDIANSYFVAIDVSIQKQFYEEFRKFECKAKFANRIGEGENIYKLRFGGVERIFQTDLTKGMRQYHSVTNVALHISYYMGCSPVYIVGMNHDFSYDEYKEKDGRYIVEETDVNHFTDEYFPEGTDFNKQNLHFVERGYRLAYKAFRKDGRELYNASVETELSDKVIPRIDINEVL